MKIHDVPGDPGRSRKRRRIGRGDASGWGKSAGRGEKGALARAGTTRVKNFEGGQMPLIRRIPKRGFYNRFRKEFTAVNLAVLEKNFEDGSEVTPESLVEKRIIKKSEKLVKVLGQGDLTKKLSVKAHGFSKTAMEKITAQGGQCEVL